MSSGGAAPTAWRNRIVRSGDAALSEITPNPANWRQHPKLQADALGAVLADVGVVQQVIINERSGRLVDGHLRVALAEQHGETSVPALWVDLDDDEERLILATLDPLGALAETNRDALSSLLGDLAERGDALGAMLDGLRAPITTPGDDDWMAAFEGDDAGGALDTVNMTFVIPKGAADDIRSALALFDGDKNAALVAMAARCLP